MSARPQLDLFATAPPADVPAEVAAMFEQYAVQLIAAGFDRYSSDAILHRIRWTHHVERGDRDFAVNNNWSAPLARWFIAKHGRKLFETREKKAR